MDKQQGWRFLKGLANLSDEPKDAERFWTRFRGAFPPDAFASAEQVAEAWAQATVQSVAAKSGRGNLPTRDELKKGLWRAELLPMRNWLREAWAITDPKRKEWKLFLVRLKFHQVTATQDEQMEELPPDSGMDCALRLLLKCPDRARVCANPDCRTPYFIAEQGNCRFCSPACARAEQRRYKQRWWHEHAETFSRRRRKQ